jgi:inorganic pyrophosphatase
MKLNELPAMDRDSGAVKVIIETPKGSRNKFKYSAEDGVFVLHRVLPPGTAFPYDFGFVPSTLAEDGDPLDVLVFTDEPVSVGCVIQTRLIGVIEATQKERRHKAVRNDRLIGVSLQSLAFRDWKTLRSAGAETIRAIEQFFISYHIIQGRTFRPLSRGGSVRAHQRLKEAVGRAGSKQASG